jgi:hypothetical protein
MADQTDGIDGNFLQRFQVSAMLLGLPDENCIPAAITCTL